MPNQRALVVGINRYTKLPPQHQLQGCVHDAHAWSSLLAGRYGFSPDDVLVLTDDAATRQGILDAFQQHLIDPARPGDLMLFAYSGHGSYTDDEEGDSPDGYDQTLVPSNATANPVGDVPHIKDDEIFELNRQLTERTGPTGLVAFIFDCCHSGTMTRSLDAVRFLPPELPPRPDRQTRSLGHPLTRGLTGVHANLWMPDASVYVMLAACRPDEVAYEYTWPDDAGHTVTGGALTYFLVRALQQAGGSATYRDVYERVAPQVSAARPQSPQMEGDVDRVALGLERLPAEPFLPAERRAWTVWLKGGAAHGVTVGSTYALHNAGAHRPDEASRLATLRVVEVQALESRTEVVSDAASLPKQGRAFEIGHRYGDQRLRVALAGVAGHPDRQQQLTTILSDVPIVQMVELDQSPGVIVWFLAARPDDEPTDKLSPPLDEVEVPTFAIADPEGQLLMNPLWADESGIAGVLRTNIARIGKALNVLALESRDPSVSSLASLRLLRLVPDADGRYAPVPVELDGRGDRVLYEGDIPAVKVIKLVDQPLYVSLFDLGLSWSVGQLWPPGKGSDYMTDDSLTLGLRDGQPFFEPLRTPPAFPSQRTFGLETFKLFATTQESDLRWLTQDCVTRRPLADDPLSQLLALAATGQRDTGLAVVEPGLADWSTAQVTFILRRGPRPTDS